MIFQMFRACKNTVEIVIEEIMDTSVPFTRKKQLMPSTQIQTQFQDLEEDELPEVKLD